MSGTSTQTTNNQWIRKASLIVASPTTSNGSTTQPGLDLSELHFRFSIKQSDVQSPNTAVIRVYNMTNEHAVAIQKEFTRVVLQAGYQNGAFGIIFDGTIKQIGRGRETNVDTYLDIFAADMDLLYNFGLVNQTLAPNATLQDQAQALNQTVQQMGGTVASAGAAGVDDNGLTGGILPRGKVLFGLWRDQAREIGNTTGTTWSIQNGQVTVIPLTGYLSGDPIVINAQTGMIGMPEATQNGIELKCLLNPTISVGRLIKLNNADINQKVVKQQGFPTYTGIEFYADPSTDGLYRVCVNEYEGDTRGNAWENHLVVLAVNPSLPPGSSILRFG